MAKYKTYYPCGTEAQIGDYVATDPPQYYVPTTGPAVERARIMGDVTLVDWPHVIIETSSRDGCIRVLASDCRLVHGPVREG